MLTIINAGYVYSNESHLLGESLALLCVFPCSELVTCIFAKISVHSVNSSKLSGIVQ